MSAAAFLASALMTPRNCALAFRRMWKLKPKSESGSSYLGSIADTKRGQAGVNLE